MYLEQCVRQGWRTEKDKQNIYKQEPVFLALCTIGLIVSKGFSFLLTRPGDHVVGLKKLRFMMKNNTKCTGNPLIYSFDCKERGGRVKVPITLGQFLYLSKVDMECIPKLAEK